MHLAQDSRLRSHCQTRTTCRMRKFEAVSDQTKHAQGLTMQQFQWSFELTTRGAHPSLRDRVLGVTGRVLQQIMKIVAMCAAGNATDMLPSFSCCVRIR